MAVPHPPRGRRTDDRRDHVRSNSHQRENRCEEIRGAKMMRGLTLAWRHLLCWLVAIWIGLAASAATAVAQSRTAILRVTVVDPSGGVIVGATVTITVTEPATRSVQVAPVETTDAGVAIIPGLTPGRYAVDAVFPGFQKRTLPDVRVRSGENRQSAML